MFDYFYLNNLTRSFKQKDYVFKYNFLYRFFSTKRGTLICFHVQILVLVHFGLINTAKNLYFTGPASTTTFAAVSK